MDTVRKDHLSCYGYYRETTPNIDKIAEKSIIFKNAYSCAPWTAPSHASIFTGLFTCQHGTNQENQFLRKRLLTISEILTNRGYETVAFSNNGTISSHTYFDQGFSNFFDMWKDLYKKKYAYGIQDAGAFATEQEIRNWFNKKRNLKRPFFMFINYMEAHSPYNPPDTYKWLYTEQEDSLSKYIIQYDYIDYLAKKYKMLKNDFEISKALYDAEINYLDKKIGDFYNYLKEKKLLENTIIIITSDHGEQFGEHGLIGHQFSVYNVLLKVPLILYLPKKYNININEDNFIQLLDIYSTIINFTDSKVSNFIDIQSISVKNNKSRNYIFAEYYKPEKYINEFKNRYPDFNALRYNQRIRSIQHENFKYIWTSNSYDEFYNILIDEQEKNNIISLKKENAGNLKNILNQWFINNKSKFIEIDKKKEITNKELIEKLRSIGYIK